MSYGLIATEGIKALLWLVALCSLVVGLAFGGSAYWLYSKRTARLEQCAAAFRSARTAAESLGVVRRGCVLPTPTPEAGDAK